MNVRLSSPFLSPPLMFASVSPFPVAFALSSLPDSGSGSERWAGLAVAAGESLWPVGLGARNDVKKGK